MTEIKAPPTEEELVTRLRALYEAADHGQGAATDFWECVTSNIGWIIDLAERAVRKKRKVSSEEARTRGGVNRALALSPERRSEISRNAANVRWGQLRRDQ